MKADKRLPQNDRPISPVMGFSTILESVMHKLLLYTYFNCCNFVINCQFGSHKFLSTTDDVKSLIDKSIKAFELNMLRLSCAIVSQCRYINGQALPENDVDKDCEISNKP